MAVSPKGSRCATQLRRTAGTAGGVPSPVVAKVAEVQIVGGIRSDVDGQSCHEEPRLLRTVGDGKRECPNVSPGKKPPMST